MEPITLFPSRLKWGAIATLGIGFSAIGVTMIGAHHDAVMAWLCTLFFGLVATVAFINLLPGSGWLRISTDGMQWRLTFRTAKMIRWNQVSEIGTYYVGRNHFVGFNLHSQSGGAARLNAQLVGFSAGLPDTFGMKAEELAALLQRYRAASNEGYLPPRK